MTTPYHLHPHCIEWNALLPQSEGNFVSQDCRLRQPRRSLAYAKALQFWAEKAQLPWAGKLHQLAVCITEFRESMKPLATFTDEDVLANDPPSPWKKITSLRCSKEEEEETQKAMRPWSQSRSQRVHSRGSFLAPLPGTLQTPHHPFNNDYLNADCSQPE